MKTSLQIKNKPVRIQKFRKESKTLFKEKTLLNAFVYPSRGILNIASTSRNATVLAFVVMETTTGVIVTTTTPTRTTQGICDYIQGMQSASYVPDSQIKTTPTLADKSVIRYGVTGPGWIVSPADDPKVTITLPDPVTGEAPYVKKIIISPHTNVEKVKVTLTKQLDNGSNIQIEGHFGVKCNRRDRLFSGLETGESKD